MENTLVRSLVNNLEKFLITPNKNATGSINIVIILGTSRKIGNLRIVLKKRIHFLLI